MKLSEVKDGEEFTWCGVRFRLSSHEVVHGDLRDHFSVTYLDECGGGSIQPGTTGLMPTDEDVNEDAWVGI